MASPPGLGDDAEYEDESDGEYESGSEEVDDVSTCSSFSESDMPDHLVLPAELHRLVLACQTDGYHHVWGKYRFVCKAWKEHIEFLAKTEWIRNTTLYYPGEMIWDEKIGKVFLNGDFSFQRLEGDSAIFQVPDCAPEFQKQLIEICKRCSAPDVEVGDVVHDVEIPEMSVDWNTLTITCPWRPLIGRVMAEELRVDAYRKKAQHELMSASKRAKRTAPGGNVDFGTLMELYKNFTNKAQDGYVAVRIARRGKLDRAGDQRLKSARQAASMRGPFSPTLDVN
ncbi:hypothetical protein MSAN_00127500 [Mycena sanguinolenta]|uniref:Uncharacterized protein n=1 Tax=Mycena sanguinolenta TaxID=230812 RepID=A0A8H6ZGU7_9AGAR|nr:hypothetical protein MSAN_00127500 [Mycena sanguinolenta]